MHTLRQLTERLTAKTDLDPEQAEAAARLLACEEEDDSCKAAFLLALSQKGETAAEVAGFARAFRALARDPGLDEWADRAIDVCGTGGDGFGSFNISTAVSFLVAAAGVPVFKHGNRSITSKCGSADLVERLGIRVDATPEQSRESLRELNFCFLLAPAYHPAFKAIMPVRKTLAADGLRTVFNLLGPLINPGRPAYQLVGVFSSAWVGPLAGALDRLDLRGGLVVHGRAAGAIALDELSTSGSNVYAGFGRLAGREGELKAEDCGLRTSDPDDLKGGDVDVNLELLRALATGRPDAVPAGLRDSVLLNAGVALWVADFAADAREGVARAREVLERGELAQWLVRACAHHSGESSD